MTDTNTSRPSEAIQRYYISEVAPDVESRMRPSDIGDWVHHSDHLAALARAREEARREAMEEAAKVCDESARFWRDDECGSLEKVSQNLADDIRALIHPTPQGETKEQQP